MGVRNAEPELETATFGCVKVTSSGIRMAAMWSQTDWHYECQRHSE
jgi:hypothetical protein